MVHIGQIEIETVGDNEAAISGGSRELLEKVASSLQAVLHECLKSGLRSHTAMFGIGQPHSDRTTYSVILTRSSDGIMLHAHRWTPNPWQQPLPKPGRKGDRNQKGDRCDLPFRQRVSTLSHSLACFLTCVVACRHWQTPVALGVARCSLTGTGRPSLSLCLSLDAPV